MAINF